MTETDDLGFPWLDDELYNKGKFLIRGMIVKILEPLKMYGQEVYVRGAIEELWKVCEDWGMWVRGDLDRPLNLEYVRHHMYQSPELKRLEDEFGYTRGPLESEGLYTGKGA